ncbi:MAG: L-threonylcarbamoyladenylate synthase [Patescibacteria group bacterium]|nr:threonylcarbamoyl-AMP synthase [Patescibacteria group bacterium]
MKIVKLKKNNINKIAHLAKKILCQDQLIVVPSDTAYGLAANAGSTKAVKKIFDFKGRKFGKGISIFLHTIDDIKKYAYYNQNQIELIKTLLPGSFTLIFKSKGKTAPQIEPPDKTIGVRVINQPFIKKLTSICPFPITATSANISGKGPHYSVSSFLKTLSQKKRDQIGLIVNAGKLPKRPTSTVVRLVGDKLKVLRTGAFDLKLLSRFSTKKAEDTKTEAKEIYRKFLKKELSRKAVLVILKGELGAGKTVFAKGIGEIFNRELVSPTFVLMDEYRIGRPPLKNLYHLDLYRIEDEKEIVELEIERLLKKGNLVLIEWGEKLSVLESLKKENVSFFLVQIETKNSGRRSFSLYKI